MIDLYQRLHSGRISSKEAESKLKRSDGLLAMSLNTSACKKYYKEKRLKS